MAIHRRGLRNYGEPKSERKKETKLRHAYVREGIRDTSARGSGYKFANFVNAKIYTKRAAMALRAHGVSRDFSGRDFPRKREALPGYTVPVLFEYSTHA